MVPGKYDITIYRGSTWLINVAASDGVTSLDLAATYTAVKMQIRPAWTVKPGDAKGNPLFELSLANGRITHNGTGLTLAISAADTAGLSFSSGVYELELITADVVPVVDKLLYGAVTVIGEITL